MTINEQIARAAGSRVRRTGISTVRREQLRLDLGVPKEDWKRIWSPLFQAMRCEARKAPGVGARYRGFFRQVAHGEHELTQRGEALVIELLGAPQR